MSHLSSHTNSLFFQETHCDRERFFTDRREIDEMLVPDPAKFLKELGISDQAIRHTLALASKIGITNAFYRCVAAELGDCEHFHIDSAANLWQNMDGDGEKWRHTFAASAYPLNPERFQVDIPINRLGDKIPFADESLTLFPCTIRVQGSNTTSKLVGLYRVEVCAPPELLAIFGERRTDELRALHEQPCLGAMFLLVTEDGFLVRDFPTFMYLSLTPEERRVVKDWPILALLAAEQWILDIHRRGLTDDRYENSIKARPCLLHLPVSTTEIVDPIARFCRSEAHRALELAEGFQPGDEVPPSDMERLKGSSTVRCDAVGYEVYQAVGSYLNGGGFELRKTAELKSNLTAGQGEEVYIKELRADTQWTPTKREGLAHADPEFIDQLRGTYHREMAPSELSQIPSSVDPTSLLGKSFTFFSRDRDLAAAFAWKTLTSHLPRRYEKKYSVPGVPRCASVNRGFVLHGHDLRSELSLSMELCHITRISGDMIQGMTADRTVLYHKLLMREHVLPVLHLLSPEYTPISKGPWGTIDAHGLSIPSASPDKPSLTTVHHKDQNRHPSLRITIPNGSTGTPTTTCICLKGGGAYDVPRETARMPEGVANQTEWQPIFERIGLPSSDLLYPTYGTWGGQRLFAAEDELSNIMSIHQVCDAVDPALHRLLQIPLDIGVYEELPVWKKDGTREFLPWDTYFTERLGMKTPSFHNRPAVLRTVSECDMRLRQVVSELFCHEAGKPIVLPELQEKINDALRYFYWANGETFTTPQRELTAHDGVVGAAQIAEYLTAAGNHNRDAATRIYQRTAAELIKIVAAVHGAGSHLGGSRTEGGNSGVTSVGPLSLRNLSCTATLHDLDMGLYFPWCERPTEQSTIAYHNIEFPRMRMRDLLTFSECRYWFRTILFGHNVSSQSPLVSTPYDALSTLYRFDDQGKVEIEKLCRFDRLVRGEDPRTPSPILPFLTNEERSVYGEYFERGYQFRKSWDPASK